MAAAAFAACAVAPVAAGATTWTVSPGGSDAAAGTTGAPFRSISRAAQAAGRGDEVLVQPGRYPETVNLSSRNSGAVFRGVGGARPVIEGAGVRSYGFRSIGADGASVENFEITGQTEAGIYSQASGALLTGNLIHHIGSPAETASNGIRVALGGSNRVVGNSIHHIGPGFQSMGIWLVQTRDAQVEGNSVYLVRKEGVRDWKGLDNSIAGNRVFLNWVGISLNTSTGSTVTNNYVYDNVEGLAVKHASYASVLDAWGLAAGRWSRVWQNTVFRSTETGLWLGQSDQPLDYVDVRNNYLSGAGTAYVRDRPDLRGAHVVVDGNAYSEEGGRPSWLYKEGWGSQPGVSDWETVRAQTGWESSGGATAARLRAPALGDLDYADAVLELLPRLDVGGDRGAQVGARGLGAAEAIWTPYEMTPVDSSSKGTWYTKAHLDDTADNDQNSYWVTAGNEHEFVVYDFGRPRTFNHLILTIYSHEDLRNPRGYRFEVSDDGQSWRTIREGENPDAAGSAHPYELAHPETGRYLRFTMLDTFCASYAPRAGCGESFVLSDLKAGLLSGHAPLPDPEPEPVGAPAPAVTPSPPASAPPAAAPSPSGPAPTAGPEPPTRPRAGGGPRAALGVAHRAVLTRAGSLRVVVTSSGPIRRGRGRIIVTGTLERGRRSARRAVTLRLGSARVALGRRRQVVHVRIPPRLRAALRRSRVARVGVTVRGSRARPVNTVVRVTR